jgi:predicted P-loop ATPase
VFVGTSNTLDFLPLDRTGNRRFAPVLIRPELMEKHILEDEKESREYIDQLWAEMMVMYRETKEHKLKFSRETQTYLKAMQKEFMPEDTKVGVIQEWLDTYKGDYVCSPMIYREALHHEYDEPRQYETREINDIMNNSIEGWVKDKQHRFADYGRQKSWKRQADGDGFLELPVNVELPFK